MSARALPVLSDLVDPFDRRITYVRLSLTDRCNYRCTYCMPEEGVDHLPREDVLSFEELERLACIFARFGVRRVRLTGGEPTVRKDVVECVARLARVPGIDRVVMTTNGDRLPELAGELARAGLQGLNVSLDTLDAGRFRTLTRRGDLAQVLAGIEAARATGIRERKLNVVALQGFNDDELGALCAYAWQREIVPRFIEWMPLSDGALYAPGALLGAAEIRRRLERELGVLVPDEAPKGVAGPARYWRTREGRRVGIISAMTEHFCDTCNRVRVTSVGKLHACLAYDDATDLRALLRGGASDDAIAGAIAHAVGAKRRGHELEPSGCGAPKKHMVSIGG